MNITKDWDLKRVSFDLDAEMAFAIIQKSRGDSTILSEQVNLISKEIKSTKNGIAKLYRDATTIITKFHTPTDSLIQQCLSKIDDAKGEHIDDLDEACRANLGMMQEFQTEFNTLSALQTTILQSQS